MKNRIDRIKAKIAERKALEAKRSMSLVERIRAKRKELGAKRSMSLVERIRAKRKVKEVVAKMKAQLDEKKKSIKSAEPKYEVDFLTKRSPKVTEEQLNQAPTTKSSQLQTMVAELKDIVEITNFKTEAIKEYQKEIGVELKQSLELKKHEDDMAKKLKAVIDKNEELLTKIENITRLNDVEVMWVEKTMAEVTKLDLGKLTDEEKAKYNILKSEIEAKTKEVKEIEAKAFNIEKNLEKVRLVVMKSPLVKSSSEVKAEAVVEDMVTVMEEYDTAISIADEIIGGLQSLIKSIADWFVKIFK
jgi:chromosome segregation ATPase